MIPHNRSVGDAWERVRRGAAVLIDPRSPAVFSRGHPSGAISVVYSERGFGERVAIAAPGDLPIMVLASDPRRGNDACAQLAAVGRACIGSVTDDPAAWEAAGVAWETLADIPANALRTDAAAASRLVLDVREPLEWETGYVPGAQLIALGRLHEEFDRLPRDREIVVICEAGIRSATAASILRAAGFPRVAHVPDGTAGYRKSGRPLAYPEE